MSLRTLVVEDDAPTRMLLAEVLARRGHEVTPCPDAESGLRLYQQSRFPLVLLNWFLPGMDGVELCRRIRQLPNGDQCLILMVTGRDRPEDLQAVLEAGADDYLAKPVDIGLLNVRLTIAEQRTKELAKRRDAERERRSLERRLQQSHKFESLGAMAGGIAHDFNNLLTAILGNATLALQELQPGSEERACVMQISQSAMRAAALATRMLAYAGKARMTKTSMDLNEVIRETRDLVRPILPEDAAVGWELRDDLQAILADPEQIHQVVINLISNATEALGPDRRAISVCTGTMHASRRFLRESYLADDLSEGDYVYVEVSDTGVGMDEDTQAKMFDPFFTTKFPGRGLGLASLLGIVRSHGGAIHVTSALGSGTTIRVLFPVGPATFPAETQAAPVELSLPSSPGTNKVLVVDDEDLVLNFATRVLTGAGFEVIGARDGQEAIDLFRTHGSEISLVILDLSMPGLSGDAVLRQIREMRSDVPVTLSSGYAEEESLQGLTDDDVVGFLQKPYTPESLLTRVRAAVGERGGLKV